MIEKKKAYRVEGHVFHQATVVTSGGYKDAADAFQQQYGGRPDTINDRAVVGACEVCGGVLFESSAYVEDENGVAWHKRCPKRATS